MAWPSYKDDPEVVLTPGLFDGSPEGLHGQLDCILTYLRHAVLSRPDRLPEIAQAYDKVASELTALQLTARAYIDCKGIQ